MADDGSNRNNIILTAVLVINMTAMSFFGLHLYRQHRAEKSKIKIKDDVTSSAEGNTSLKNGSVEINNFYIKKIVRFESLITNLSGEDGRRIVRLSLEAKCEGASVLSELNSLKPKVRDIIVIEAGSFTAEELVTNEGKEKLKSKVRDRINAVLATGKVLEVFITELELN